MSDPTEKHFIYGVYVRKSSENEDRQVQSLERQKRELNDYIRDAGLTIYPEIIEEDQSAFHPGREQFGRLVQLTVEGKVNAWLCWHFNRLSRNPVDAGQVIYLMDQGKLDHVRTREKTFWNTGADKFILNLELSISKKDSDDKSALVRSGILQRNRRGYPTGRPPVGYLLVDQGKKGISRWAVDSVRFEKVQAVLRRFLEGGDSIRSITEYAQEIGLTTRPTGGRQGNHPISISYMHQHILMNPVYAGFFFASNHQRFTLNEELPRILSEADHRRIRTILERNGNTTRRTKRSAAYRGIILSEEGAPLSAEVKFQVICDCRKKFAYLNRERCPGCNVEINNMRRPRYLEYTYYYNYGDRKAKHKIARTIEEKVIEKGLCEFMSDILPISRALRNWSSKYLCEIEDKDLENNRRLHRYNTKRFSQLEARKQNIKELLMDGHITPTDYERKLDEVEQECEEIQHQQQLTQSENWWLEEAKQILDIAAEFRLIIENGDEDAKRQALSALTSNLNWDGKILSICTVDSVSILRNGLEACRRENPNFEPEKDVENIGQNPDFEGVRSTWSRYLNAFRTQIFEARMPRRDQDRDQKRRGSEEEGAAHGFVGPL